MSHEVFRRFICDRCGTSVEIQGTTTQPPRWARVMICEPFLCAEATWDIGLCEPCVLEIHKLLKTPEFVERFRDGGPS